MSRLTNAWRVLAREQRLAALCSIGLFVSMLLPWYSKTDVVVVRGGASSTQQSLSAFQAFSFVEAAVLLVSAGILALLFARAEQRDFHLPGGDGTIVMIAGGWASLLIFYRLLDKPGLRGTQKITATVGVEWGIFIALLLALGVAYTGARMRTAEHLRSSQKRRRRRAREAQRESGGGEREPESDEQQTAARAPRITDSRPQRTDPSEDLTAVTPAAAPPDRSSPDPATSRGSTAASRDQSSARRRPRFPPAPSEQMSFEDPPPPARGE